MGGYDTSDLHRRQHVDPDGVGHAVLGSRTRSTAMRRRALGLPVGVLALGILLSLWGPLPGLGLILVIGAVFGLATSAVLLLTDGLS